MDRVCSQILSSILIGPQSMEQSMDSNGSSIPGKMVIRIFSSNYLIEYSLPVIVIIVLFVLITAKLCPKLYYGRMSTSERFRGELQPFLRMTCPDIHHTIPLRLSRAFSDSTSGSTVINMETTISSSVSSQNSSIRNDAPHHFILRNKHYQNQKEPSDCGLENFGSSCYVNSALQCLFHIHSFVEIILNLKRQPSSPLPPIASSLYRLLTRMQSISHDFTNANEIKFRIGELNERFSGINQQDSHEFLTVLLEALHDELMNNYQNSSIGELMHGVITSTVKCLACEKEIRTEESFISLPLPINQPMASSSIDECFKNLLASEQLGANGQWFCHQCQKLTDATKKLDLNQLPQVLILQLKRFTYDLTDYSKITTKVHIEEVLDLTNIVSNNYTDPSPRYNLVAVLEHTGTLARGHYTTYARHLYNHRWYHFDDKHVRPASWDEAIASDAYVLIYERMLSF